MYKKIIVLLVVLVALIAVYFVFQNMGVNQKNLQSGNEGENQPSVTTTSNELGASSSSITNAPNVASDTDLKSLDNLDQEYNSVLNEESSSLQNGINQF